MKATITVGGVDLKSLRGEGRWTSALSKQLGDVRKACAEAIAGIVAEEFIDLVKNAPQYSGNFAANMAVAGGSRIGRIGGETYFDPRPHIDQAMQRGSVPAIKQALSNNSNLVSKLTAGISNGKNWLPQIIIYNRLEYAQKVEDMPASRLRDPNKPGVNPIEKARASLEARVGKTVVYGSPEFERLRNFKVTL